MKIKIARFLTLLMALGVGALAIGGESAIYGLPPIDKAALPGDPMRFQLVFDGEVKGEMFYSARFQDGDYVIFDGTTFYPDVRESAAVVLDGETLLPKRALIDADFSRQIIDADLDWDGNAVAGEFTVKGPEDLERKVVPYEAELPDGTIIRESIFTLVPALPLEVGAEYSTRWFNTLQRKVEDITLIVSGTETVTVPTGEHEVYKVEIRGGTPENIAYVTTDDEHELVRIDVVGMPMQFERLPAF